MNVPVWAQGHHAAAPLPCHVDVASATGSTRWRAQLELSTRLCSCTLARDPGDHVHWDSLGTGHESVKMFLFRQTLACLGFELCRSQLT